MYRGMQLPWIQSVAVCALLSNSNPILVIRGLPGVNRVRCDLATQTVIVSGNVPPKALLRRVRWIKRHSSIVSFGVPYAVPSYGSEYPAYNPYALEPYSRSPTFGSVYGTRPAELEYDMEYGSAYGSPYGTPYTRSYSGYMNYWSLDQGWTIRIERNES